MERMTSAIFWCCPFCQRMFDVGCCPEHRALEPYTAPDNKSGPQRSHARPPVQQEESSDGRSSE